MVNDDEHKKWILTSLGKKWRDHRCELFEDHYDWELSMEHNCQRPPEGVDKDHWAVYVQYRRSPKQMVICTNLTFS